MRLFIAIPFEPPMLDALTQVQASLKAGGVRGGFTARQNLHMTLAFLGEVRDPRPVIAALDRVPLQQGAMTFEKTEMFRDILVCAFRVEPQVRQYVRDLRAELDNAGIGFDRKPFRPHVTLVRRAALAENGADAVSQAAEPLRAVETSVRRVCLMRTDFVDGRPRYSCIQEVR